MATARKFSNVFTGLRCVHCGELDSLCVKVDTLAVECKECGEEVTEAEVEATIATWRKLFGWVEAGKALA